MRVSMSMMTIFVLIAGQCFSQQEGLLTVRTTVHAQFVVTDQLGRRTGQDPRGSANRMQGVRLREIPGAQYSVFSAGDSPTDEAPQKEDLQFDFEYSFSSPANDGVFTIETIGIELGSYFLFIAVSPKWGSTVQRFDSKIAAVTDTNRSTTFKFTYSGVVGSQPLLEKLVSAESLSGDTETMFRLGWISPVQVRDKYIGLFQETGNQIGENNFIAARNTLLTVFDELQNDSGSVVDSNAYSMLTSDVDQLFSQLPSQGSASSYSLFAVHSLWLEQNSDVFSGDIGVNEAGVATFLDSQVELSVGIGTSTALGSSIKANRIKVKQGSTVGSDVYYNELENNGTITGTQHTPLALPLTSTLPVFKPATPGTQNIEIPQNGTQILQPGSYGDVLVRRNGKLILTGGAYHLASFNTGDNVQLLFQAPSEVRIAGKFDTDQGTYIGPQDTSSLSANQIVFYIGGINGNNGNLGATPKAAQIGIANAVKANFYVPNGTLWIRQNSRATGAFIGKDVNVGIGVKIWLKSAF